MLPLRSPLRKEGLAKITGRAKYVDDLVFPGVLWGVTVRSSIPRGKVRAIDYLPGVPWEEITVVTARDIPGKNAVALLLHDQPFLADGIVNHPEEPVVLLAHPDRFVAEEARKRVRITYDPLPATLSLDAAIAGAEGRGEAVWTHPLDAQAAPNVFKRYEVRKGDVDAAWAGAAHVVEGVYETGAQEQLYIETNGVVAVASAAEGVTVWGSMQCPYYIHKALLPLFGLPEDRVRIIQSETGGGFGGKEEYPSILAGHAALLAWKSGKPVKIIYDRAEDLVATTKRHPSRTRIRTALDADGRLLAQDIEFDIDGGAYCTLSPVVLSRGTIHAAGPYAVPNVRIRARALATNHPPHGAFRGFGAPQSIFAMERHLEKCARAAGISSQEIRRRNFVREGQTTATGQVVREKIDQAALMERALADAGYAEKRERFKRENPGAVIKRGVGFASFFHGSGFTGSGEKTLASVAGVEGTPEGRVRVLAASTEIGQGTNTVFSQIVAGALGLPYERVEVAQPDTANVPNSGPTVASRTVMVVGKLVERAATSLRQVLLQSGKLAADGDADAFAAAIRGYVAEHGKLRAYAQYQQPPHVNWDDATYQGDAYGAYAWATYVAEVEVDTRTYEARVVDFVARQEVGKVMHPVLAAGQIEGGVAQGIGFAVSEKVVWKDGRMANGQMTNYIMPTAADAPPIRVFFEELPYEHGPSGAKGIGELPMDGPGPAILNAIADATGLEFDAIPLLPEDIHRRMTATPAGTAP